MPAAGGAGREGGDVQPCSPRLRSALTAPAPPQRRGGGARAPPRSRHRARQRPPPSAAPATHLTSRGAPRARGPQPEPRPPHLRSWRTPRARRPPPDPCPPLPPWPSPWQRRRAGGRREAAPLPLGRRGRSTAPCPLGPLGATASSRSPQCPRIPSAPPRPLGAFSAGGSPQLGADQPPCEPPGVRRAHGTRVSWILFSCS